MFSIIENYVLIGVDFSENSDFIEIRIREGRKSLNVEHRRTPGSSILPSIGKGDIYEGRSILLVRRHCIVDAGQPESGLRAIGQYCG